MAIIKTEEITQIYKRVIKTCDICGGDATDRVPCKICGKDLCGKHLFELHMSIYQYFPKRNELEVDGIYCRECLAKAATEIIQGIGK